jgi:hypothetical protein
LVQDIGYPFIIKKKRKRGNNKKKARLDLIPTKKFSVGYRAIIEDYCIINNGMGDIIIEIIVVLLQE